MSDLRKLRVLGEILIQVRKTHNDLGGIFSDANVDAQQ